LGRVPRNALDDLDGYPRLELQTTIKAHGRGERALNRDRGPDLG
jgi:hypothetical protein